MIDPKDAPSDRYERLLMDYSRIVAHAEALEAERDAVKESWRRNADALTAALERAVALEAALREIMEVRAGMQSAEIMAEYARDALAGKEGA